MRIRNEVSIDDTLLENQLREGQLILDRFDQRSESRNPWESQVDMQQQEALVGWRSSRELVPKEFCWSVLVQHSTMRIHSEVQIDGTLLENRSRESLVSRAF